MNNATSSKKTADFGGSSQKLNCKGNSADRNKINSDCADCMTLTKKLLNSEAERLDIKQKLALGHKRAKA